LRQSERKRERKREKEREREREKERGREVSVTDIVLLVLYNDVRRINIFEWDFLLLSV
jgi:hypothetical protein